MLPRLFQMKGCTNQDVECRMMRNGVCMSGFFSALGPTNVEICHAHAREKDCTELCSQALESDPRGTARIVVRGGVRRDERTLAEFVATGAWIDGSKQPEGSAQAGGSADGQPTHCPGSSRRRSNVAARVVPGRATAGHCCGLVEGRSRRGVCGVACGCHVRRHGTWADDLSTGLSGEEAGQCTRGARAAREASRQEACGRPSHHPDRCRV